MHMKKVLITLFVAILTMQLSAQENLLTKGERVLNVGIGFGSTLYNGSGYNSTVPPISASFEVGVKDDVLDVGSIGVGGYLGYSAYKWEYAGWGHKFSDFILGVRGTFHYPLVEKLDTYTGLMLGYEIISSKDFGTIDPLYDPDYSTSGVAWSWYAGGRYYFNDNFAVMAELGYGIAYLNIGIAYKF